VIKLTLLTIAWLIGIALSHWLNPSLSAVLVLFPAPLALIALWRDRRSVQRLGVYALALLAGAAWVQLRAPRIDAGHVAFYNDTGVVVVRGVVESDPELGDTTLSMRVRAVELDGNKKASECVVAGADGCVPLWAKAPISTRLEGSVGSETLGKRGS